MVITKSLKIDLVDRVVLAPIHAVQCDSNTRAVAVTLTAGGVAWEPPADTAISVAFKKPDGKKGWYDKLPDGSPACSVSGNVVTAILAPEALTAAGKVDMVIVFQDKNLNQLATFGFAILVEPNPAAGRGISNDYYNYSNMEAVNQAMEDFFVQAEADYEAFTQKVEAEQAAFLEAAGEALAAVHEAATADAPAIVCEASGEVIAVSDASDRLVQGLKVFGKTTQDGTPSPDNPVPQVSVGDSGSVGLTVAGKNLLPYPYYETTKTINGITFTDNGDGTITADGTATADAYFSCARDHKTEGLFLPKGTYTISGCPVGGSADTYALKAIDNGDGLYASDYGSGTTGSAPRTASCTGVVIRVRPGVTVSKLVFKPQIERGTTVTAYEPYKAQTLTFATLNGLPGIPVTSGGNYTDENGQQYIANYRDWARGVDVQRITQVIFDGSEDEGWGGYLTGTSGVYRHGTKLLSGVIVGNTERKAANGFCSHYPLVAEGRTGTYDCITGIAVSSQGNVYIYDEDCNGDSKSVALKEKLASNPITCLFQLVTPIETPIPAEELAAYAALHTNKPNTTVHNDGGAHMELSYVADTKLYIDNKIAAIAAAVLNNT